MNCVVRFCISNHEYLHFPKIKGSFQSCVCLLISVWWRQIADRNSGKKMELTFKTKLISGLMGFSMI